MSNFIIRRPWDFKPTDELEHYLASVIKEKPILNPPSNGLTFVEGLCAYVVHREGQFQTQFIIVNPGIKIPEHQHPNVDSFEVTVYGINFTHSGQMALREDQNVFGRSIRVRPRDIHGGWAGEKGGCFISVQHWQNGVAPTSVGLDWDGEDMGAIHRSKIIG